MYTPNSQQYVAQMPKYSAYNAAPMHPIGQGQPNMYLQQMYGQQPMYQQQYQQPMMYQQPMQQPNMYGQPTQAPVPPTVGGNIETGPSTPGFHNSNYPVMNMGYNYNQPSYNNPVFMNNPGYSPFANSGSSMANPNYDPYQYHGIYATPQAQDRIVTIPGRASNMPPLVTNEDIKEVNDLHRQMMDEIDEAHENQNNYTKPMYQYNYYGQNQTSWIIAGIQSKYNQKVYAIINKAKDRRKEFEKRIYLNAARAIGREPSQEEIDSIFEDRQVVIPAKDVAVDNKIVALEWAHEVDPSDPKQNPYLAHNIEVSSVFRKLVGENSNMNEFFKNVGYVVMFDQFQARQEARRNYRTLYHGQNSFKNLIKKRKNEREENGAQMYDKMKDLINSRIDLSADEDTKRSQAAGLLGDLVEAKENGGTLGSFMNDMAKFGSFKNGVFTLNEPPDFSATKENTNSMETEYDQNRNAFISSIYASGGGNAV